MDPQDRERFIRRNGDAIAMAVLFVVVIAAVLWSGQNTNRTSMRYA